MQTSSPNQSLEDRRRARMAFWQHLEELRRRLLYSIIGVVAASGVSLLFTGQAIKLLLLPMGDVQAIALHPTESIVSYFRIAFLLGLSVAMPFVLYQLMAFIAPGLTKNERRIMITAVIAIGLFFITGVLFAGGFMVPLSVNYLRGFLSDTVLPTYSISEYISFVTTLMISTGVVFQTPLLMALIARLGIVNSRQLAKSRRYALVGVAVVSAFITPTPDAFNMLIVMAPLLVLYELGILFSWLAGRARQKAMNAAGLEVQG